MSNQSLASASSSEIAGLLRDHIGNGNAITFTLTFGRCSLSSPVRTRFIYRSKTIYPMVVTVKASLNKVCPPTLSLTPNDTMPFIDLVCVGSTPEGKESSSPKDTSWSTSSTVVVSGIRTCKIATKTVPSVFGTSTVTLGLPTKTASETTPVSSLVDTISANIVCV